MSGALRTEDENGANGKNREQASRDEVLDFHNVTGQKHFEKADSGPIEPGQEGKQKDQGAVSSRSAPLPQSAHGRTAAPQRASNRTSPETIANRTSTRKELKEEGKVKLRGEGIISIVK